MRLAFFSDSHGDVTALRDAMDAATLHGKIDMFLFLGDGIYDFLDLQPYMKKHNPMALIQAVRGNNDPAMHGLREEAVISAGGIWIYLTHGHRQQVKLSDRLLIDEARYRRCRIALFGHTHKAFCQEKDGILLMNPGSVALPAGEVPAAGMIEITEGNNITPKLIYLKSS